jgi:hypothetical protein
MLIFRERSRLVKGRWTKQSSAVTPEGNYRISGTGAKMQSEILSILQQLGIENAGAPGNMLDFETKILFDQITQGVRASDGIVVDLGHSGLVNSDSGEFLRPYLAAKPVGSFEHLDVAGGTGLSREVPCCKQAARSSADYYGPEWAIGLRADLKGSWWMKFIELSRSRPCHFFVFHNTHLFDVNSNRAIRA